MGLAPMPLDAPVTIAMGLDCAPAAAIAGAVIVSDVELEAPIRNKEAGRR